MVFWSDTLNTHKKTLIWIDKALEWPMYIRLNWNFRAKNPLINIMRIMCVKFELKLMYLSSLKYIINSKWTIFGKNSYSSKIGLGTSNRAENLGSKDKVLRFLYVKFVHSSMKKIQKIYRHLIEIEKDTLYNKCRFELCQFFKYLF